MSAAEPRWLNVRLTAPAELAERLSEALLTHVSPMGWAHVGLTGDYLWERPDDIAPNTYRSLNDPTARLRQAA